MRMGKFESVIVAWLLLLSMCLLVISFDRTDRRKRQVSNYDEQNLDRNGYNWLQVTKNKGPRYPVTVTAATTSSPPIPGMETTRSSCEDRCFITTQYNPVCGDNNLTYQNEARLRCAQRCGISVNLIHYGACSILPPHG